MQKEDGGGSIHFMAKQNLKQSVITKIGFFLKLKMDCPLSKGKKDVLCALFLQKFQCPVQENVGKELV